MVIENAVPIQNQNRGTTMQIAQSNHSLSMAEGAADVALEAPDRIP